MEDVVGMMGIESTGWPDMYGEVAILLRHDASIR